MRTLLKLLFAVMVIISANSCKKSDKVKYPEDGLVSYFPFDGNLKDVKAYTAEGINNGNAVFIPGKNGSAITFNGINQYIVFNKKTFRSGNNISISFWFKTNTGNDLQYFMFCHDFGLFTSDGKAGLFIYTTNGYSAKGPYVNDTWTHFTGTFDGTDIKTYINGVLKEVKNNPGNVGNLDINLIIGFFNSNYWAGSIDDLFIYNKTLSQSEVTQLYNLNH